MKHMCHTDILWYPDIKGQEQYSLPVCDDCIDGMTGEKMKKQRTDCNVTQNDLAKCLDVSTPMISHWENQRRPINRMQAIAIRVGIQLCESQQNKRLTEQS